MSLQDNLIAARAAVQEVRTKMPLGAGNRFDDARASLGLSAALTLLNRVHATGAAAFGWVSGGGPKDNGELAQISAARGDLWQAGNCMEQSSIALLYLVRIGIRPVEWMALTNLDHAFVVIGRPGDSDPADHLTWGDEAVVCDPWDKDVYEALYMNYRMHRGQNPCSQYRGIFSPRLLVRIDE